MDDERAKATYNVGEGELTVILPKETPGEYFPDLDMLTKLLVRKGDLSTEKQIKRPLIEVISSGETLEGTRQVEKDEDFDWEMPQEIRQEVIRRKRIESWVFGSIGNAACLEVLTATDDMFFLHFVCGVDLFRGSVRIQQPVLGILHTRPRDRQRCSGCV